MQNVLRFHPEMENDKKSKKMVDKQGKSVIITIVSSAGVAELADAQASGACGSNIVWVQVPSPALNEQVVHLPTAQYKWWNPLVPKGSGNGIRLAFFVL